MTIRWRNPRLQGLIGVGAAIDWFSRAGYSIAIPIDDSQPWNLVVDDGSGPQRVQVKTTTARRQHRGYIVTLVTAGGNQSFHTRKPFDNTASELLFVLTDDDEVYLFPSRDVTAKTAITLCKKYERYRQPRWPRIDLVVGEGFEPSKA